jgi:hypothetical protein
MLSYCYSWTPLVILGSLGLLTLPLFGGAFAFFVLAVGSLVLLAGLATAILWVPFKVSRAIFREFHGRPAVPPQIAIQRQSGRQPAGSIPAGATALVSDLRSRGDG